MRLRPHKIDDLARGIAALLRETPQVEVLVGDDAVRAAVAGAISENFREEDEIEREVDDLIAANAREIESGDLDVSALRAKFKREIARRRGFQL